MLLDVLPTLISSILNLYILFSILFNISILILERSNNLLFLL